MADVVMPRLSDSMEEGTILQWLKQVGDEVAVGDELVEIETDKANMAYESDVAGTLTEIVVEEGETVPIGETIARVGDSDEETVRSAAGPVAREGVSSSSLGFSPEEEPSLAESEGRKRGRRAEEDTPSPTPPAEEAKKPSPGQTVDATAQAKEAGDGHRPKASPLARRLAKEQQLDLKRLHGSGPGGRIVKADVERAVSSVQRQEGPPTSAAGPVAGTPSPETAKGAVSYEDPSKLQSTVARRMAESKATAPHFYLRTEVDMSRAVEGRALVKQGAREGDIVPSFNDMVVKACALALREHPRANGAYRDGRFELYSRVNVGVAVAARDALVVPTVFDADRKGLRQIASESRALAQRVRDGQITPPELSGATFTVSNLGMYGIDSFSAVINPPQAAILAVGAIKEQPAVRDGELSTAHLMTVDLACDHRILYGAPAAEFLAKIRVLLEEPLSLAL
ncbi:MAG TPA: dihydrolipoamide acetyltransferase family protein [Solirubrobacterales bacterium]|jgi:pyruvate dehydrogenase E2 component (dihydrolipoamide acetyltransferase)|nr:dihydrolipoamide acetyltransferase family protein [Solirubrobacterales bacterium]